MLFRADFMRQKHVPGSIETNHGLLSKIIGEYLPTTDQEFNQLLNQAFRPVPVPVLAPARGT